MKTETENNNLNKKSSKRNYIIAAACFVLLAVIALVVASLNNKSKPDPESERIIREAVAGQLNKEPNQLTDKDYAIFSYVLISAFGGLEQDDLSFLLIPEYEFSDIKLLDKFTNLQELDLYGIKYAESKIPQWVKILRKLGINIENRFVIDLKSLEGLSNLQTLRTKSASVKNLEPLSSLINLKFLDISNTYVTNLKPLKKLKNLEVLYIQNCPNITDKQVEELQKALPN